MTLLRSLLALAALTSTARAAEPWADPKLPVTDGLELWLDAGKVQATKDKVAVWRDASGKKRDVKQPVPAEQPALVKIGGASVVRFDGENDALRFAGAKAELTAFTAFIVVSPRSNPGDFRGFLAFNAANGRDYETGLTIDMGPAGTPRFTQVNVEGRGFGGARSLTQSGGPFGQLYQLGVAGDAAAKSIYMSLGGELTGARPWSPAPLSIEQITVGARFYTNGPGEQVVRGPAKCDIAEILVFNRVLSADESKKVRGYLDAKHAELKKTLPPEEVIGEHLVPVKDAPPVQVLLPGFAVKQLPLDITNVNNVKYRHDGVLVALCYNGDIWHLRDTDGDGIEDKADLFFESKGRLRGPIGLALTPPGYPHGEGVLVAAKGKVSLILGKDKEVIVADGWKEITQNVDAVGVALDPKDGAVYFGRGTGDFANAYRFDKDGKAHYDVKGEYGTIIRVAPDFKSREVIATGVRFSIGLHFNRAGDLFCSDQEGATWLPNGNPLDELLHIQKGRHYGFPPRHPKHLPDVIDEPSTFDYGPQHQSTCGFCFNEPVKPNGPTFGPKAWAGDVIMTGESRGKLYRTQLVKTASGYVARNQLIACISMLTTDCCVSPDGSLVVACHSGGPDWGSGPAGKGKLFKITYSDRDHPQPMLIYSSGPREVRIEFDREVDPQLLRDVVNKTKITAGKFVRAGDRFETIWPGYAVVQAEKASPRFDVPVRSAQLTPDRRTLVLATDPMTAAVHYALTLPGMGRPAKPAKGELRQVPEIDLDFDLSGVELEWKPQGDNQTATTLWLPSLDLAVSRVLTTGSATHERFYVAHCPGKLYLRTQLNLTDMLRPAVQPGSKIDYEPPAEKVALVFNYMWTATVRSGGKIVGELRQRRGERSGRTTDFTPLRGEAVPIEVELPATEFLFYLAYSTAEDKQLRPLPLHRALLPWANTKADLAKPVEAIAPAKELDGGSWARGRKEFFGNDAACSKCHAVNGQGGLIGPDLTNLIHRDYASVLRDVTQPSFALNPDYIPQTINLHTGKQLLGVVRTIDGKLHVGDKDGQTAIIDKADVEGMKPSTVSIMPDDLLKKLGPDRTRDLLTFLLVQPPSMPRDYAGSEKRPKPRTMAEVNAVLAGSPNPPEKTKRIRVVLVAGPKDHGKGEHDYPAWLKAWEQLLSAGDNIDVVTAMEWPPKEEFQKADAMVFYQYGDWNEKRAADIDAFLERGGGLTYIHWAVAGRKDAAGFAKRIGLASGLIKFRHGPLDLTFNKEARHPIARNIDKVALVDESYWMLTGDLPKDRVIAWGTEEKEPRPLFWSLEHGKGRVFVSIPGHYSWSFDDPLFRVLLLRGIAWTAREPVDRFNDLVLPGADVAK